MGCASSSPIVESGKNLVEGAKETMSETLNKGEKALQDVGETAKEGFQSGIDSMKETMHSVANNAEQGVETVMGKIGDTFSFHNSKAKETVEHLDEKKDEFLANASDAAAEVVSEAETVLASEAESAKEAFLSKSSAAFETVHSMEEDLEHGVVEAKDEAMDVLQDLEGDVDQTVGFLGDTVERVQGKVEELNEHQPKESPLKEIKKEEPSPTFWEAAADAILLRRGVKSMDFREQDNERNFFTQPEVYNESNNEQELIRSEVKVNQYLTRDDISNTGNPPIN